MPHLVPARLIRALLTLTAFAVVWLVASPARAESLASSVAPLFTSGPSGTSGASSGGLFSRIDEQPAPPVTLLYGAPLCDVRGATTFAPPPQMQETEVSLDTGLTLEDCLAGFVSHDERVLRAGSGRAPLPQEIFSNSDPAVMTALATLARAPRELLPVPDASTTCPASGVRSTVDRPPRT